MKIMKMGLLISCCLVSLSSAYAQSTPEQEAVNRQIDRLLPKPIRESPNAASLGKYGDYEATSFNGVPNTEILIFEAVSGSLKVPISLKYHAAGVKLTDHASWVGLGWSLSVGGQVSRQPNGKNDEDDFLSPHNPPLKTSIDPCEDHFYLGLVAQGSLDTQPDVWSYSFPGKSGKFILRDKNVGAPLLVPAEPFVVKFNNAFNIVVSDDAGVDYTYGVSSIGSFAPVEANTIYLGKMQAANRNDKILFGYQSIGNVTTEDEQHYVQIDQSCNSSDPVNYPCPPQSQNSVSKRTQTSQVAGTAIETIVFEGGKVDFVKGSLRADEILSNSLHEIVISAFIDGTYVPQKKYRFDYSYFRNASNTADLKLRLDGLRVFDKNGVEIMKYKFSYTTPNLPWESWAADKYKRDYWGYFNGLTGANNQDLIVPTPHSYNYTLGSPVTNIVVGTANRNPNATNITDGVLSRIDFPTGGYSAFEYEPNMYSNAGVPTLGGGIRIKKIISSDGVNSPTTKEYKYSTVENSETSTGNANFPSTFQYHNELAIVKKCCISGGCVGGVVPGTLYYTSKTFYSSPAYRVYDGYGSAAVVYPYVTEYIKNSAGQSLGKTVYEYDGGVHIGSGSEQRAVGYFGANGVSSAYYLNSIAWQTGHLTKKTVYNDLGVIVKRTQIGYQLYNESSQIIGLLAEARKSYTQQFCFDYVTCPSPNQNIADATAIAFTALTQTTGAVREISRTETEYVNGIAGTSVTTGAAYDPVQLQVLKTTKARSDGASLVTEMRYPYHYTTTSGSTGAALAIHMLKGKNVMSTPIETYSYVENGANKNLTEAELTLFRRNENNVGHVVLDKHYLIEKTGPLTIGAGGFIVSQVNGTNNGLDMDTRYKERLSMGSYDMESNLSMYSKSNDVPTSFIYGYEKKRAIAQVTNVQEAITTLGGSGTSPVTEELTLYGTIANAPIQLVKTFTTGATGTVTLRLGVPGAPTYETIASWSGITSGSTTLLKGNCGLNTITFNNVAAGTHTLTITLTLSGSNPDVYSLGACGDLSYTSTNSPPTDVSVKSTLLQNFEELMNPNVQGDFLTAHSGRKYYNGDYTVSFTIPTSLIGVPYKIEYWYLDANQWKWITKPYTGTSMVLNEGSAIDDVRIYPVGAQMKSYTYDLLNGITSEINESGRMLKYDYDTFGRLWRVRNDKGEVEKHYTYKYSNLVND